MSLDKEGPGKTSGHPFSWSSCWVNSFHGEIHRILSQSSSTMMSLQSPTPGLPAKLLKAMMLVLEKSPFFELFESYFEPKGGFSKQCFHNEYHHTT